MRTALLLTITACAVISPLLTFVHLWQVKEWRIDRLLDHFKSEGMIRQCWGIARIPVIALSTLGAIVGILPWQQSAELSLILLAGISAVQSILRRQPEPIWTAKARSIAALTFVLAMSSAWLLMLTPWGVALPLLVLAIPLLCFIAWVILLPLDAALKRRILRRARQLRSTHPELTVIGITGSMGKTTTKELIACALGAKARATPAYVNSEIGVGKWIIHTLTEMEQQPSSSPSLLVIEMGAYREGEIHLLCEIAQPTIGVVTAVGTQHIALFGSQQKLLAAKSELPRAIPESGHVFLNVDSDLTASMQGLCRCPVTTVGTGGRSDLEALDSEETMDGLRLRIGETAVRLPLHGTQNIGNVLLAFAVAEHLGVPRSLIVERLSQFKALRGTFSLEKRRGVTIVNDTHNCSPESASAAVRWAVSRAADRKILLTSGIIEQGRHSERVHRDLGALCSGTFDRCIFLHKKFAQLFALGYGESVEVLRKDSERIPGGSLLVCLGRMPESAIDQLLPNDENTKN